MGPGRLFRVIFIIPAMGVSLALLLATYLFYFPLGTASFIDTLGNLVPWFMLGACLFGILGLLVRSRTLLFSWIPLALGLACMNLPFRFGPGMTGEPAAGLRIMSYNTRGFYHRGFRAREATEDSIRAFITGRSPDILCAQEFGFLAGRRLTGYPYRYVPMNHDKATMGILSKYPIIATGEVPFPGSRNNALFADIVAGNDTVRVYNVHLQSYRISGRSFLYRQYGKRFLGRVGEVARMHSEQVAAVRAHQAGSPYPSLICGDFNATAFTRTYHRMKMGMNDGFREAGNGFGNTFFLKGAPFRIDYILADQAFKFAGFQVHAFRMSDHLPVEAVLEVGSQ